MRSCLTEKGEKLVEASAGSWMRGEGGKAVGRMIIKGGHMRKIERGERR